MALTSHIMKTLERLVLEQLRPMVRPFTDPLQFAYQPRLGVEDGIIYLLNRFDTHLDKPASTVRVMFFDFSSAFNTIRPALLGEKMAAMQVDALIMSWIVDYLIFNRTTVRTLQSGQQQTNNKRRMLSKLQSMPRTLSMTHWPTDSSHPDDCGFRSIQWSHIRCIYPLSLGLLVW